jgi:hypothetical protein
VASAAWAVASAAWAVASAAWAVASAQGVHLIPHGVHLVLVGDGVELGLPALLVLDAQQAVLADDAELLLGASDLRHAQLLDLVG